MPFESVNIEPEVVRHLRAARQYMSEHGWIQNASRDMHGNVCTMGAIYATTPNEIQLRTRLHQSLVLALDAKLGFGCSVAAWNDLEGRTKEDVLKLYDDAIELELSKAIVE